MRNFGSFDAESTLELYIQPLKIDHISHTARERIGSGILLRILRWSSGEKWCFCSSLRRSMACSWFGQTDGLFYQPSMSIHLFERRKEQITEPPLLWAYITIAAKLFLDMEGMTLGPLGSQWNWAVYDCVCWMYWDWTTHRPVNNILCYELVLSISKKKKN